MRPAAPHTLMIRLDPQRRREEDPERDAREQHGEPCGRERAPAAIGDARTPGQGAERARGEAERQER